MLSQLSFLTFILQRFHLIITALKTAQCEHTDHDCGYEYNRSVVALVNNTRFGKCT